MKHNETPKLYIYNFGVYMYIVVKINMKLYILYVIFRLVKMNVVLYIINIRNKKTKLIYAMLHKWSI